MTLIFDGILPMPPTLNQYYRARNGKNGKPSIYKSVDYKKQVFVPKLLSDKRLKVAVTVNFADNRKQDLDNRIKALLDALNYRLWFDDSQIDEILIKRGEIIKGGQVHLQVWEMDDVA